MLSHHLPSCYHSKIYAPPLTLLMHWNTPTFCRVTVAKAHRKPTGWPCAKKVTSKGCYTCHLVTNAEPTWSNCISFALCSYLTMVRCDNLDKITISDHGWMQEQTC
jgi:hypothetical protein